MQTTDEEISREAAACDETKVSQARRMMAVEKFLAGADLFEEACRWTLLGIRNQFPDFSEEQQRAELRRRIAMI